MQINALRWVLAAALAAVVVLVTTSMPRFARPTSADPVTLIETAPVAVSGTAGLIAVNSTTHRAYVTAGADRLAVINGADAGAEIAIPGCASAAMFPAVNPTTNRTYVNHTGCDFTHAVENGTNTVIGTISTGAYPDGLAANPSTNRLYIANAFDENVYVIDTSGDGNTLIATIPIPDASNSNLYLTIMPATNRLYVAVAALQRIVTIDLLTNAVADTFTVAGEPYHMSANPVTGRLYAIKGNTGVLVVDASTGVTVAEVPVAGAQDLAVDTSTNSIYVTNGSTTLTVIDGATSTVASTVTLSSAGQWVGADTSNGRVYVSSGSAVIILERSGSPTPTPTATPTPTVTPTPTATPPSLPTSTDQCKNDGWKAFAGFRNQGDCVSFVATKGKNALSKR